MKTLIAVFGGIGLAAAAATVLVLARYSPGGAKSRKVMAGIYLVIAVGELVRVIQEVGEDLSTALFFLAMTAFFFLLPYAAYKGPASGKGAF